MKFAFQKQDTGIFAQLIRIWTFSKYSHCEVIFSDGLAFSSHVADGGTRFINLSYPSPAKWDIIEIPTTVEEEIAIKAFCYRELNCKYDWLGIFLSQVLPFRREHPDRWFCSELCAAILKLLGYLRDRRACEFSPGSLARALRKIFP